MIRLLIAGTGTEVGKTWLSGLLARHLLEKGLRVRYVKPVQTGSPPDDDAAMVREISGLGPEDAITLLTAPEPVAPCFVFDPFPFEETAASINAVADCDVLLVECAGGLLVPLDKKRMNWHLARECELDIVLAAPNRLGCLNDILLNLRFMETEGLRLHGLAINDFFASDQINRARNKAMLETLHPGCIRYVYDAQGIVEVA